MSRIDHTLFDGHRSEIHGSSCPLCSGNLVLKNSKKGLFLGCSRYPECEFIQPISDSRVEIVKEIEDAHCPECDSVLQIKKGRFGLFIGCSNYPSCHYIASPQEQHSTSVLCPKCSQGNLVEKTNRFGKRFFSCTRYPNCRYVINSHPIATACPECGWSILVKRNGRVHCPQKSCRYSKNDEE